MLVARAIRRVLERCGSTDHSGRTVMRYLLEELTAEAEVDSNIVYPGKDNNLVFPEE